MITLSAILIFATLALSFLRFHLYAGACVLILAGIAITRFAP